ncbi:hypothetical protein FPOA_09197 [Fusarium poae]|uniref:Uncharacterized protein n=1 Tax=Fusarium poae TaxID=36050 RepID=A0A1B8AR96_FUSPO|nr:hypothetical protein FPOA_09197 [Fusarium poae]
MASFAPPVRIRGDSTRLVLTSLRPPPGPYSRTALSSQNKESLPSYAVAIDGSLLQHRICKGSRRHQHNLVNYNRDCIEYGRKKKGIKIAEAIVGVLDTTRREMGKFVCMKDPPRPSNNGIPIDA